VADAGTITKTITGTARLRSQQRGARGQLQEHTRDCEQAPYRSTLRPDAAPPGPDVRIPQYTGRPTPIFSGHQSRAVWSRRIRDEHSAVAERARIVADEGVCCGLQIVRRFLTGSLPC
jgi:hypothetical protein